MVYFGFYLFLRHLSCILDQFCAVNKFALSIYALDYTFASSLQD